MRYFVKPPTNSLGVDLGHDRDYIAVCLLEYSVFQTGERDRTDYHWIHEHRFHIRHIERIPLQTNYIVVADYIRDFVSHPSLAYNTEVVLDSTGVGLPVWQFITSRGISATKIRSVKFTGGQSVTESEGHWHIPRRVLLSNLHTLLANGHLKIGRKVPHANELLDELNSLQFRISRSGNDTIEPALSTDHDDLAIAAALSAYFPARNNPAVYPRMKGTHSNLNYSPPPQVPVIPPTSPITPDPSAMFLKGRKPWPKQF